MNLVLGSLRLVGLKGLGLNQRVLIFWVSSFLGSLSFVMNASIWIFRSDDNSRPDVGRIRSSMEMSEAFLNEQIKVILGISHNFVWDMAIRARLMEMNGVIPLPPLIIAKESCLEASKKIKKNQKNPHQDYLCSKKSNPNPLCSLL